jgi:hypothetical protein
MAGSCPFGLECIYAHGEPELRSETQNEILKLANSIIGSSEALSPRQRRKTTKKQWQCRKMKSLNTECRKNGLAGDGVVGGFASLSSPFHNHSQNVYNSSATKRNQIENSDLRVF